MLRSKFVLFYSKNPFFAGAFPAKPVAEPVLLFLFHSSIAHCKKDACQIKKKKGLHVHRCHG